jgi:hypothetical protein
VGRFSRHDEKRATMAASLEAQTGRTLAERHLAEATRLLAEAAPPDPGTTARYAAAR